MDSLVELQMQVEDEGIAFHIENEMIDISKIEDQILLDLIEELKYNISEIKGYISRRIQEERNDDCEFCD